jgi:hypothetical protein
MAPTPSTRSNSSITTRSRSTKHAAAFFFFIIYLKVLTDHAGTVYLAATAATEGRPIEAGKTYVLRVPKNVPAQQFWSLTMYDRATWAFVRNPWIVQVSVPTTSTR